VNIRASCLAFFLALFSCLLAAPAVYADAGMTPAQGTVGSVVTISNLTAGQYYVVQWDGVDYASGTTPSSGSATFTVPETIGGSHSIVVQSPQGTQVFSGSFSVLPSIVIDPNSGAVGTSVSVSGEGFAAAENNVVATYDGNNAKTDIIADSNGSWNTTFVVPASAKGSHAVSASGSTTSASAVGNMTFSLTPAISISPLSGGVGTQVTVSGQGFVANEASISVTCDSKEVKAGITADLNGSWSATFAIPNSPSGSRIIDASGSTTSATDVPDISFAVAPGINIDHESVHVGDIINVTGSGFGQDESGILVTFDGIAAGSNTTADDNGHWSVSIAMPVCVNGVHTVAAYGNMTAATSVSNRTITVSAKITLSPASGDVGDTINVTGSGFSSEGKVVVTYGGVSMLEDVAVDSTGSFSDSFKAPGGKHGGVEVVATEADGISASSDFAMDTTPPSVPQVTSPTDGSTVGFIGDTKVNFDWTDVTDPSGVYYDLQVATDANFKGRLSPHIV
jgi:hypothetical protein